MRVQLVGQPSSDSSDLYQFLVDGCANEEFHELHIATAWAKQSGLLRVEKSLAGFRSRGGTLRAFVGISEGGATRQGLEMIHSLCNSSFVFHDQGRTFHPKLYFFRGVKNCALFVGSNNLTAGGIFWNYEAALHLTLDVDTDGATITQVDNWFKTLTDDVAVCLPLNDELIALLSSGPGYRVGDEQMRSERTISGSAVASASVFGKSKFTKRKDPLTKRKRINISPTPEKEGGPQPLPIPEIVRYFWFKKLTNSDALQQKTSNTKITGNLRLGQARHKIDHTTFFRHRLFEGAAWGIAKTTTRGIQEKADVAFEIVIGRQSLGVHKLSIDHAEYRVAGQGNTPTWLHWGKFMGEYLRKNNHVGDFVTIEAFADNTYRLTIAADPIGEVQPD
ncbi:hypothetical protein ACFWZ0_16610 [[Kitasatospora] papulosa]|uniref:hypothetical protein n=1 Tax=[Kitasatospora] papulosa TaxID=1464011 RepID=UPI00369D270A